MIMASMTVMITTMIFLSPRVEQDDDYDDSDDDDDSYDEDDDDADGDDICLRSELSLRKERRREVLSSSI